MKKLMSLAVKEEGYDEFLAEQIAKGIAEIEAGNVIEHSDWLAGINQFTDQLIMELEEAAQEENSLLYAS